MAVWRKDGCWLPSAYWMRVAGVPRCTSSATFSSSARTLAATAEAMASSTSSFGQGPVGFRRPPSAVTLKT